MSRSIKYAFLIILLFASLFRIIKINSVPPSLNWDETAAAYNAYTIRNWGMDEYGNKFPLVFKSFGDDKHPVHIYLTAMTYNFLGVSDFTTRLPSVLIGVLTVVFIYLVGKLYFKSEIAGLFAALFLGMSAYHIHYSRGLWEANFALFFLISGLALFKRGLDRKNILLPFSYFFFGLGLLSYHSAKVVILGVVIVLTILYIKQLLKLGKVFYIGIAIFAFFLSLLVVEPRLLGLERVSQTKLPDEAIHSTYIYKKTGNEILARFEVASGYFKNYFTLDYLFKTGDELPRGSLGEHGQFFMIHALPFPLGVVFLALRRKWKILIVLISWLVLAPIPAALAGEEPNSTRAIFMLGVVELVSAYGIYSIYKLIKNRTLARMLLTIVVGALILQAICFMRDYFVNYAKEEAIQWQYGMKQVANYANDNSQYNKVLVTKVRSQPYIFFLYYSKTPLLDLLSSAKYDETGSKSYNTIESYGKYNFGNWDIYESMPKKGYLYIVTKNEFLAFKRGAQFNIKEIIKFPGGDEAFYVVSVF